MSARMMRKLQGSAADNLDVPEPCSDDDDLDTTGNNRKHLNPFDLLNQQSLSESEFKEDDNETEHASTAASLPAVSAASKKKKKKRKKKTKSSGNHISSEDNERSDKYLERVDPLLDKVSVVVPKQSEKQQSSTQPKAENEALLSVELKHLNPQNEMRRTFGKRVVKMDNKRGRQKITLRSTYMVTAKESWPPLTKNIITMKLLPGPDRGVTTSPSSKQPAAVTAENEQWFAFEHSQYYQSVQNMFLSALERTDSDFLINLIRRCPYHVDSLIQLSELCKMTEDFSLAAELIERALLVLESSLHINFNITSGNCRLDYRRQENRAFYIVLFKHAQYLEARACCRTAFEIAKLIMSFQPEVDPLAMVLVIDYYALRSKQYEWFIRYYEKYDSVRNLSQLPNMAYSYALAVHTQYGDCEKSNNALQYALLMFPGVLRPLLEELSVQTDKRVLGTSYFNSEVSRSQSPALHQLVCLYICRAKIIWRQGDILLWLERNVNGALDRIDRKDEVIADYKEKRSMRYGTPPRPILRHVILSDYKEKVPLATFVAKEKQAIMTYDPLPPMDTMNCYQGKSSSSSSPTNSTNRSVSIFFQSLLPTFNMNDVVAAAAGDDGAVAAAVVANVPPVADEVAEVNAQLQALNANLENAAIEAPAEAAASYRDLTQSLTTMVDAMRDFLQNFRISEHLQNADASTAQTSNTEEEESSDYND